MSPQEASVKTDVYSNAKDTLIWSFGGPPGCALMSVLVVVIPYYLYFCVAFNEGMPIPAADADAAAFWQSIVPTWTATGLYLGWMALQVLLQAFVPGPKVEGVAQPDGTKLSYCMNGHRSFWITLVLIVVLVASGGLDLSIIYREFGALLSVGSLFAIAMGLFLYPYGKAHGHSFHTSGNAIQDFFMGTGLNPRIPARTGFDLKLFFECRPGLFLWALFNAVFAWVQYQQYGFVSTAMILVNIGQLLYVWDCMRMETALLSTMDIRHENFGFMLAFGDTPWVPFTYCIQSYYLIHHVHELPLWAALLAIGLAVTGQLLFRMSNKQKDTFRRDPDNALIWGKPARYLETQVGTKLLASGTWGLSRHFNYVGDELMAISWSIPCLFATPIPYFYPIYFALLLIHRERRDHLLCAEKYGEDWERYCALVKWRIIPGVY
jgi:protein-S-isoprenylcysteine O-methyltransferase Ste14